MKKESLNIKSTGALILLILVVMSVLIYINSTKAGGSKFAFKELESLNIEGQLEAADKNSHVANVDELMVEANGAVVKARNIKGEAVWSQTLLGQVVLMKGSSINLYAIDGSKRLYCISKAGKLLWDKQLEGDINELFIDKSGDVLVDFRNSGGSKIQIISGSGVEEGSMVLENAAVIAFASGEGENTISIVDISSQTLKSKLITLDLKGAMGWSDNFDNQIIPMLSYGKDNTLLAIGEKTIYKYKGESKKPSKLDLDKTIYCAALNEANVVAVVRSRWGYDVKSYDLNFKEIGSFAVDKAPKGIILGKNYYILYYGENLVVCDLKGSAKSEYKSIPNIKSVSFTDDGNIILVSDRILQKLNYQ